MSNILRASSSLLIFPGLNSRLTEKHIALEERLAAWTRIICSDRATHNDRQVYLVGRQIVRQAYMIASGTGVMNPEKITEYLLTIALEWLVRDRLPLQNVMVKMPKSSRDLGLMVLAEGLNPDTGRKLDPRDFEAILPKKGPKK